jgi:hypothetical protein
LSDREYTAEQFGKDLKVGTLNLLFARFTIFAAALIATLATLPVHATVITRTFSGTANGGTGSGLMTFNDNGGSNTLTIRIDNTSPNLLNSGVGQNSSIITGWGFSVTPNLPQVSSWSIIAGNGVNLTSRYRFTEDVTVGGYQPGQLFVEEFLQTSNGINGGIYNAANPGNTSNAFPDIAVFTINFCAPFTLQQIDTATLRLQRVGTNGAGSLKLLGYAAQQFAAPEPSALLIFLTGLLVTLNSRFRLWRRLCAPKLQQA